MDKPAQHEANETRLRMALRAGRMAVWDYDIANDRLNWSDEVFELFGGAPFAVTLEQFTRLIHPDDVEMVQRRFDEAAASGQPFYAELRVPQPDGSLRWAADYGTFEYDAEGRPVRVIGLVQDITEQRRLRDERAESETRLRQLIDQSPLAIQIIGTDGRTRSVNQAWQRLWGVPLGALAQYNLFEDRQLADNGIQQALRRVLDGGECEPLVAVYDRTATPSVSGASGRLTVKTRAYANRDANGAVRELVLMQEDVSLLVAAEGEVRRHREHLEDLVARRTHESVLLQSRLQSILDAIPGVAGYWDRERICRFANQGYRDWVGAPAQTLIGRRFEEVFSAEHFARVRPAIDAVLAGQPQRFEAQFRHVTTGALRSGEIHYVPDRRGDEVVGFFVLAFDITDLKAAKEAADAASVAKSAFLANMSHEIRTPLNAIIGMAAVMQRAGLEPVQAERLRKLAGAGEHLLQIVNAILEMTKIDAGKVELVDGPVQVATLLSEVAAMLEPDAAAKGLQVHVQADGLPTALSGDATRLRQALLNLYGNAIKFTDAGTVTLRARVEHESEAGVLVRFEVIDTGMGVPAEVLPRLFTIFEQADNSTSRRHGGTGLGLAITRRLARMMDGDAGAESTPGQGSCFWFSARLGAAPGRPGTLDAGADRGEAEAAVARHHAGRRVLLCEDEPVNREIAQLILASAGLDVLTAVDGEEAVRRALADAPDLILMDMQMPHLDGLEATRRIRATPRGRHVPIVAMTANAFIDDRQRCLDAGMDDFVAKPIRPEMLFRALLRGFGRRG